jgi:hypothetical protein
VRRAVRIVSLDRVESKAGNQRAPLSSLPGGRFGSRFRFGETSRASSERGRGNRPLPLNLRRHAVLASDYLPPSKRATNSIDASGFPGQPCGVNGQ